MSAPPTLVTEISDRRAEAAQYLPAWTVGKLPPAPAGGWWLWVGLIGPGVVLAGTSIGSGEWLFGPAVTAQYGASNAAVPLAAVFLGHLPQTASDQWLVKTLGFAVFLLAFVPLIFGGTVYRMLEKIMTAKLVLVLGYLSIIALVLVSWPVVRDVAIGFFRVGTVPLRAQTIVLHRHFSLQSDDGEQPAEIKGTWEQDGLPTGDLFVMQGTKRRRYDLQTRSADATLEAAGEIVDHHVWEP